MYAILNRQEQGVNTYFGVEYNPLDEPNAGYEAAVFAAGFSTISEIEKFAEKNNIHLS